ncbi:uncharacterized protein LOC143560381 isoform X2 [Bidens hawaiensis]|uniref:uncharacterized protein LOC143560381 isoform X2 n=1 Tax=Bidens hawaiensis TaxID=980011 RepID=UPI00404A2A0B
MDWYSYVIICLKRTKEGWNGKEPYNGPLTFLAVLYAHELQLKRSPDKAITPAIRYVNTGFLANLEGSRYDNIQDDDKSKQNVEDQVMLETCIKSAEGQPQRDEGQPTVDQNVNVTQDKEYEVQPQTNDGQAAIDQNVNLLQEEEEVQVQSTNHDGQTAIDQSAEGQMSEVHVQETNPDSALNLKLPIGPPNAHLLSGLSANLVRCNQLQLPRDKKVTHALHTI